MAGGTWDRGGLLAFDVETTGTDRFSDVPVSFALIEVSGDEVVSHQGSLVDPGRPIPAGATAIHGITSERARSEGVPLDEALAVMAEAVIGASRRGVPVVGMKLDFDLTMLDAHHRRRTGNGLEEDGFRGPVLDALVLDRHLDRFRKGKRTLVDLCAEYAVVIGRAHDAAADAQAALEVVRALCRRYPALCHSRPEELHRAQIGWHGEWARSFSAWRVRQGLDPLDEGDAQWPIAIPSAPGAEELAAAS
jgi:DNA polymerase III subunit epsilon